MDTSGHANGQTASIPVPAPEEQSGGMGGVCEKDVPLVEKALRNRWPIPAEKRGPIVEALVAIAANKKAPLRNRTIAARVLVAMDAQNMEQERRAGGGDELHVTIDDISDLTDEELVRRHQAKRRALGRLPE